MLTEVTVNVLVKVLAMLFKGGIGGSIANTFSMKYRYWFWQYIISKSIVNNPIHHYINILVIIYDNKLIITSLYIITSS